ncbi:MAG: TrpB-like pyridoxal phosphate-dependent enzyme [Christensenellaceae bacterium]|jgi:tryptophan synthase beta chain|nr:TrpB-like pyridoxal phosphate-dependent enzyme [Christensenellaceae bacterium]
MDKTIPVKTYISETEAPQYWYNLRADMKEKHPPFIHPGELRPCVAEDLYPIFCKELVKQELNQTDQLIPIPDGIQQFYKMFRPSPLIRAYSLEKALGTPAAIYYKFEGNNTSGSHKLNSAATQAYYAKQEGITSLATETGAGQWGTALAMACDYYDIDLTVYMVKVSSEQKPYRKIVMETYAAKVIPSPSPTTESGRKILALDPNTGGSLGCAISEAIEKAVTTENCRYVLGSVLDHVLLHQSVVGLEAKTALDKYGITPDVIIGCAGGGSNLGGLIAPYMGGRLQGKNNIQFIAVEPQSCPSFTRGKYTYDFGDTAKTTPLMKMYTLGNGFIPSANHAGGLRYHGMSPILSKLYNDGYLEARAYSQTDVFDAAKLFIKTEGILPAPESTHALKAAIDIARECTKTGEKKTILFGLTGTGYFDLMAYAQHNNGTLSDKVPTDEELQAGFDSIPNLPAKFSD